jgi:GNAT superfamily N-acetyltransferase
VSTLRDGRSVALRAAVPDDAAAIAKLRRADPRERDLTGAHGTVALIGDATAPAGYAAWFEGGEFVCSVEEALQGLGLGTGLLRNAAEQAGEHGLAALSVELPEGAHALAAMLRDCGLVSFWDLDHPVGRVELRIGTLRPGWVTPEPAVLHSRPFIR